MYRWMEVCLKEELLVIIELEEVFRNGVFLVKLGNFFFFEMVFFCKIFDKEFKVLNVSVILGRILCFFFEIFLFCYVCC